MNVAISGHALCSKVDRAIISNYWGDYFAPIVIVLAYIGLWPIRYEHYECFILITIRDLGLKKKISASVLPPIFETLEWMNLNTSLNLSVMPWDNFTPPRYRPPETMGIIYSYAISSVSWHQHTHLTWVVMKDVAILEGGGVGHLMYASWTRMATWGQYYQVGWGLNLYTD